jgi:three-Cys-motif partner protein
MHLDWQVIQQAGQSGAIDMFLNFPIMDINRNALLRNPADAKPEELARMNRLWGDDSWRDIAYVESGQQNFFGDPPDLLKQNNETIAKAFRKRLRDVAGFACVPEPLAMRNKNNAVLYYLVFAAANQTADKIIKDIFSTATSRASNALSVGHRSPTHRQLRLPHSLPLTLRAFA